MMFENLPPELKQLLTGLAGLLPTAVLSRVLAHHHLVRLGHRKKFWSPELWWELPAAAFCAIVGGGVAAYLELPLMAQHATVGIVGWLGPRGMEVTFNRWLSGRKET